MVVVVSLQTDRAEGGGAGRCGRERESARTCWPGGGGLATSRIMRRLEKGAFFKFWCQDSNSGARIPILVQFATMRQAPSKDLYPFLQNRHYGEEREREREREREERERERAREREDRQTDRQTDIDHGSAEQRARASARPRMSLVANFRAKSACFVHMRDTRDRALSSQASTCACRERERARERERRERERESGPQYGGARFGFHGPRRSPGTCRTCRTYCSASLPCHPSAPICFTAYCSSAPPSITPSFPPSLPRS